MASLHLVETEESVGGRPRTVGCDALMERAVALTIALFGRYGISTMSQEKIRRETFLAFDDLLTLQGNIARSRYLCGGIVPAANAFEGAIGARCAEVRRLFIPAHLPFVPDSRSSDMAPRTMKARVAVLALKGHLTDSPYSTEVKSRRKAFRESLWRAGSVRKYLRGHEAFTKEVMAITDTFRSACSYAVACYLAKRIDCDLAPLMSVGYAVADVFSTRLLAVLAGAPEADAWRAAAAEMSRGIPVGIVRHDSHATLVVAVVE